jgi:hypothetical protein
MGTVVLNGTTSGSTTLSPTDAVTATLTLPNATSTLLASATSIATPISGTPTSSNFLRGDGTWNSPSAGAMTLITTTTASSSSSIDFTGLSSTYKTYVVIVSNCVPTSDGDIFSFKTSTDNGANYDGGASNYITQFNGAIAGGNYSTLLYAGNGTRIWLTGGVGVSSTASNGGWSGVVNILNPANVSNTYVTFSGGAYNGTPYNWGAYSGIGSRLNATGAVNAIRFYWNSSTIASGTFKLYGIS